MVRSRLCSMVVFLCSVRAYEEQYISPQLYSAHPFDAPGMRMSGQWEPLRVHVDVSDLAASTFTADSDKKLKRITSTIMPLAIKALSKHLHVIPVEGNLKFSSECLMADDEGFPCCGQDPACTFEPRTCGDISIPEAHMHTGVPRADFVVYLTANEDDESKGKQGIKSENLAETLAETFACEKDQYDRPLAGWLSLKLALILDDFSTNYLVTVLAHELSHLLGWNPQAFEHFRDEQGNVRTGIIEHKEARGKTITLLTTPAVTKYVRSHFGCDSLAGLELEDQGNEFTAGYHPEARIYPESYMAGFIYEYASSYMIDAMALSVFQDSGWYQVKNLDQAGRLTFGRGMGCRVATHKCNDYGPGAEANGMFCSEPKQSFCTGNRRQVLAGCNIQQYKFTPIPSIFQYLSSPTAGGKVVITDFCPRAEEYSDGDCTEPANEYEKRQNGDAYGTRYHTESRCFMSSLKNIMYQSDNSPREGRCFRRTCKANALEIHVGDRTVSCPVFPQATYHTVAGYNGRIECPAYIGLDDIRCTGLCRNNDTDCLGIKGSVSDSALSGALGRSSHTKYLYLIYYIRVFDILIRNPVNVAILLGGFMAFMGYFNPGLVLTVCDFFCPPKKTENMSVLDSLKRRQARIQQLDGWSDLNAFSVDDGVPTVEKQQAVNDLVGQKSHVVAAITKRLRACAEAQTSPAGNAGSFVESMLSCSGFVEGKETDAVTTLIVFVGAVWNPHSRSVVLDLNAVRKELKDAVGMAFVFAPIPAANSSDSSVTQDMPDTEHAQAVMAAALQWPEARCDPVLHSQLCDLTPDTCAAPFLAVLDRCGNLVDWLDLKAERGRRGDTETEGRSENEEGARQLAVDNNNTITDPSTDTGFPMNAAANTNSSINTSINANADTTTNTNADADTNTHADTYTSTDTDSNI